MKKYKKAAAVFKQYAADYLRTSTDQAIHAHMKRAEMLIRLKKWREAEKEMHITISLYRKYRKKKKLRDAAEAAEEAFPCHR